MNVLKTLAVLTIVTGSVALVFGTGAFSAIDADRTSDVGVASNQNALVGLDIAEPVTPTSGSRLVTVSNNFDDSITVAVTLTSNTDPGVSLQDTQKTIPEGGSGTFEVDVDPLQRPNTIEFQLQAASGSGGAEVSLTRTASVAGVGLCGGETHVIDENVNGDVDSDDKNASNIELASGVQIKGDVDVAGCVILNEKSQIKGDTSAGGRVEAGEKAKMGGDVEASDGVEIANKAEIKGDLDAGGAVDLGADAIVKGDLSTSGSLSMGEKAQVKGDADAGGAATLGEKAQIDGDLDAGGAVDLGTKAQIKGDLSTGGDLTLGEKAAIDGDVSLTENVTLEMGTNSQIKGDVEADDPDSVELICSSGAKINGEPCESYTIE